MNKDAFVIFDDVTKRYRDTVALDDVSFQIGQGEIFGYIGPNGAGKTTTIKIMVGLLSEFQGQVTIGGCSMPAARGQVHELLGYLPQQVAFQEWRTVDHALRTFGRLSGIESGDLDRRIEEVLGLLLLTPARYKKVSELSGGMIQKVGLAQALLHDPKFLVLDEPLSGLDPASRHQVKMVIRQLSQSGTTVLFSSHILSDVQDVATKIGILSQGRLMHVGTLEELKEHLRLTDEVEVVLSHNSGRCQELEALPGIARIEATSDSMLKVHLNGREGHEGPTADAASERDETIHQLLVGLIERDCRVRSLQPVSRSLDQIYLSYLDGGEGA
jgi:ABC-2 type transport system ATP-binding protein